MNRRAFIALGAALIPAVAVAGPKAVPTKRTAKWDSLDFIIRQPYQGRHRASLYWKAHTHASLYWKGTYRGKQYGDWIDIPKAALTVDVIKELQAMQKRQADLVLTVISQQETN